VLTYISEFIIYLSRALRDALSKKDNVMPRSVAARSKAWVYGRSLAGLVVSNPTGVMDVCLCCVLSVRGLCDGLITRLEKSYRPTVICLFNDIFNNM
jgi:hypothetical protein